MNWRKSTASANSGNCAEVAAWRTATASTVNGQCAEVAAWRKSSASANNGACAEVGQAGTVVLVRDTADRGGPVLAFSGDAWTVFLAAVRSA